MDIKWGRNLMSNQKNLITWSNISIVRSSISDVRSLWKRKHGNRQVEVEHRLTGGRRGKSETCILMGR